MIVSLTTDKELESQLKTAGKLLPQLHLIKQYFGWSDWTMAKKMGVSRSVLRKSLFGHPMKAAVLCGVARTFPDLDESLLAYMRNGNG